KGQAQDVLFDVNCTIGVQQNERWTHTTSSLAADIPLTINVHDPITRDQIGTASAVVRAAPASAGSGTATTALIIGDSQVAAGRITQTMLDLAGADVHDLALVGTRGTAPNLHEGRGGWRVDDYTTA